MPTKKVKIPATLRNSVWNLYIGNDIKSGTCFCCGTEKISTANFECGHIKSEKDGGEITITNLRPVCSLCNKSMGTQNMEVFMAQCGFVKNNFWNGIQIKNTSDNTIKLKKKNKDLYQSLNLKELKLIRNELNIKETTKSKIIENLMEIDDFNYDDWYSKYIEKTTIIKLKMICKYFDIAAGNTKQKILETLRTKNIQIYMIEDLINNNKNTKYVVQCWGDKSKTCIHCVTSDDGTIHQCDKCRNAHVYFTDDDISQNAERNTVQYNNTIALKNVQCSKCNVKTCQDIYNNPFFNFIKKADKLTFGDKITAATTTETATETATETTTTTATETTTTTATANETPTDTGTDEATTAIATTATDITTTTTADITTLLKDKEPPEISLNYNNLNLNNTQKINAENNENCYISLKDAISKHGKIMVTGENLYNHIGELKKILVCEPERINLQIEALENNINSIDDFTLQVTRQKCSGRGLFGNLNSPHKSIFTRSIVTINPAKKVVVKTVVMHRISYGGDENVSINFYDDYKCINQCTMPLNNFSHVYLKLP
jgi:hypothetical protein